MTGDYSTREYDTGVRVTINSDAYGKDLFRGQIGIIEKVFAHGWKKYGVRVVGMKNAKSSNGLFWFDRTSLRPIPDYVFDEEVSQMPNDPNFIVYYDNDTKITEEIIEREEFEMKMLEGFTCVDVQFIEGTNCSSCYTYAMYDNFELGDFVVVQSRHHGFGIAKIAKIYTPEDAERMHLTDDICGREIVCKVDFAAFHARHDKLKKMNELRKKMDTKVKQLQNLAIYEVLAGKDSELADMLKEYKDLAGLGEENGN